MGEARQEKRTRQFSDGSVCGKGNHGGNYFGGSIDPGEGGSPISRASKTQ